VYGFWCTFVPCMPIAVCHNMCNSVEQGSVQAWCQAVFVLSVASHWFRTCCPVNELRLPFWSLLVLLGTMPADNMSIACRQRTVLRFSFMSACMIVCVIFTKVCLSDSIAQQWQTCLDCSFQFHCFKILLLLVSVSLIPDQCNGAELSILLCIAWGCQT